MLYTPLSRCLEPVCGTNRWGHRHRSSRRPSFVPHLLVLEDRTLPSTLTIMTNAEYSLMIQDDKVSCFGIFGHAFHPWSPAYDSDR